LSSVFDAARTDADHGPFGVRSIFPGLSRLVKYTPLSSTASADVERQVHGRRVDAIAAADGPMSVTR
jgi:hypothetical protein